MVLYVAASQQQRQTPGWITSEYHLHCCLLPDTFVLLLERVPALHIFRWHYGAACCGGVHYGLWLQVKPEIKAFSTQTGLRLCVWICSEPLCKSLHLLPVLLPPSLFLLVMWLQALGSLSCIFSRVYCTEWCSMAWALIGASGCSEMMVWGWRRGIFFVCFPLCRTDRCLEAV